MTRRRGREVENERRGSALRRIAGRRAENDMVAEVGVWRKEVWRGRRGEGKRCFAGGSTLQSKKSLGLPATVPAIR